MKNISFSDMVKLVEAYSFRLNRIHGGHHIFVHFKVSEIVNLQNGKGTRQSGTSTTLQTYNLSNSFLNFDDDSFLQVKSA